MKVLVGRFSSESNEHSRSLMSLDKFILKYGEDCIDSMYCRDIFEKNGIELIPSIGAIGHPHGPVTLQAYEFIVDKFKQSVKEHLHEIDGIFLFLHGASKVIGLQGGSAENSCYCWTIYAYCPSYGSTRKFIGRISFKCKSIKML